MPEIQNIERFFKIGRADVVKIDFEYNGVTPGNLYLKREDKLHPLVSGNKFRKLKYNALEAFKSGSESIVTFGGAFSNHIAAVAVLGHELRIKTIGLIRGDELEKIVTQNPTLQLAENNGMQLRFLSREEYRSKDDPKYLDQLEDEYPNTYILPEGGTNRLAVDGCKEMISSEDHNYNIIGVAVGTGGTLAGVVEASSLHQTTIGFSALKGTFQKKLIVKYTKKSNYMLTDSYCSGGYAKIDLELIRFINDFKRNTGIPLDPIYTGKMMYGIYSMIANSEIDKNSRILALHTGGLQGIAGMNSTLKKKGLPQIES